MEELLTKIQSEIDTLQAEVDTANAAIADKRDKLKRMHDAKHALCGTTAKAHYPRKPVRGYRAQNETARLVADLLENGPMSMSAICSALNRRGTGIYQCLKYGACRHWFEMIGKAGNSETKWGLTESGRNRQAA